ncbi:MAG: asparaginase [Candidatus Izemoplasma sp.]|nr:asparaginase [Candidatus Izemoplasma sp.]
MQNVALIYTGGTIGMTVDDKLHGAIPTLTPEEITNTLSGIEEFNHLFVEEFSRKQSPAITPKDMQRLSRLVQSYADRDDIAGVVIVHGTDTLEETAFYLHCTIRSNKPVVVTGSMKNASELGYDGVTNLFSSIRVCFSPLSMGKGTLVVLNDTINSAIEVTKTHTMSLDTFKSIEFGPLGIIDQGEVIYYREITHFKDYRLENRLVDDVYLIKAYAGMTGDIIDYLIEQEARGIVIEALGRGNLPPIMIDAVDRAINSGIFVVIVSRCVSGRVLDSYAYPGGGKDLVNRGCILGGSLNGQKARILLMLAISNDYDHDDICQLFSL